MDLLGFDIDRVGLPTGVLHGRGARAGGKERNCWNFEFSEDLSRPIHHDVDDGANRPNSVWACCLGREEVFKAHFQTVVVPMVGVMGRARTRWWRRSEIRRRRRDFRDFDKRMLAKKGGNGGGEVGRNDKDSGEASRSNLFAELNAW